VSQSFSPPDLYLIACAASNSPRINNQPELATDPAVHLVTLILLAILALFCNRSNLSLCFVKLAVMAGDFLKGPIARFRRKEACRKYQSIANKCSARTHPRRLWQNGLMRGDVAAEAGEFIIGGLRDAVRTVPAGADLRRGALCARIPVLVRHASGLALARRRCKTSHDALCVFNRYCGGRPVGYGSAQTLKAVVQNSGTGSPFVPSPQVGTTFEAGTSMSIVSLEIVSPRSIFTWTSSGETVT
jgi:hypothetical protein